MTITYRFRLDSGKEKRFAVELDPATLALLPDAKAQPPAWARLSNRQCPQCPFSEQAQPYCPVARNLARIIEEFRHDISFDEADIVVTTENREFRRRAPLQNGISGLMGLVMATSGCPVLDKLRPMAYLHMPFPSAHETMYRAISMYLTAQYFVRRRGGRPDWDLADLVKIYEAVSGVNVAFAERLRTMEVEDATLNAVVSLDCFASMTSGSISYEALDDMERVFAAYLK